METKFYHIKSNEYTVKKGYLFNGFILLLFLAAGISFFINGNKVKDSNIPYYIFTLLPIGVSLFEIGRKIKVNILNKTVTETVFGYTLKKSTFCKFSRFIVTKKRVNFINNGVDVSIQFKNSAEKISNIKLSHFSKNKQAEEFLNETKALLTL